MADRVTANVLQQAQLLIAWASGACLAKFLEQTRVDVGEKRGGAHIAFRAEGRPAGRVAHVESPLRTGQPDEEEPPLFRDVRVGGWAPGQPQGQQPVLAAGEEDDRELQYLR